MSVLKPLADGDAEALTHAALYPSAACVPLYGPVGVSPARILDDFAANSLGVWRVTPETGWDAFVRVSRTQIAFNGTAQLDILFAAANEELRSPFRDLDYASTVIAEIFDRLPLSRMTWQVPWTSSDHGVQSDGLIAVSASRGLFPYHRWRDGSLRTESLRVFSRDISTVEGPERFAELPPRARGASTLPLSSAVSALPESVTGRLTGRRVGVRELRRSDYPWFHDLVAHDRELRRWFFAGEYPTEDMFFRRVVTGLRYASVIVSRGNDQTLGVIGCHDADWISGHCSVAVILDPSVRGAGWPLEGVVRYVLFLATELPLVKIYFHVRNAELFGGSLAGLDRVFELEAELEYVDGRYARTQRTYALYAAELARFAERLL